MVNFTPLQPGLLAALTSELPPAVRLQRLVVSLREAFACTAVVILRLDAQSLRPQAAVGVAHEVLGRSFMLSRHPRLARILAQREPVQFAADDQLPDPYDGLFEDGGEEPLTVHDCIGTSLYLDGRLWGAVTFDALRPRHFDGQVCQQLQAYTWLIETVLRINRLEADVRSLGLARREQMEGGDETPSMILGSSPVVCELLDELGVVADSDLPVLLQGETGVGKELFARWLHAHSPRARKPLVYVNCAALPESLAESELFGHLRGAFSGAGQDRPGRFEAANGGSLFLDEVGELPLSIQAKLLRALQNGEIQRLGADQPHHVDVRIIAATNRRLWEEVRDGRFRVDLYHRLSVYPLHIPPLRERGRDVLVLAGHFLELNRTRLGLRCLRLSSDAERALMRYDWPGNVRELEHVISRAALKVLNQAQSRSALLSIEASWLGLDGPSGDAQHSQPVQLPVRIDAMHSAVEQFQTELITAALARCQGKWAAAARDLQMDPSNLRKLARRLNLI